MKKYSRREWINNCYWGSFWFYDRFFLIKGTTVLKEPVRMMYNENPYGPSDVAKEQCAEHSLNQILYHASSFIKFKDLIAELNNIKPENVAIGFDREILNKGYYE